MQSYLTKGIEIRESLPADLAAIEALYPDAFPDEDLLPVVRELLDEKAGVVSLVAHAEDALVGNVIFTACAVAGRPEEVTLLAPLGVATAWQGRGIGSALVRAGLQHPMNARAARVCVLGDPAYYGRFGFTPDDRVSPPYPLPAEWRSAWQSLGLREVDPPLSGTLKVPAPWRKPALWGP